MGKNIRQYMDNRLNSLLPQLGIDSWDFILKIHKELLNGIPLTRTKYYSLTNLPKERADAILKKMGELDAEGNIAAFSGLSLTPTNHKFVVNGKTFYTWCVVDAILFAEWLAVNAHIFSNDPVNESPIELQIEGDFLSWTKPYPLYVSWVDTMDTCDIRGSLCDHVSFFASEKTAGKWLKDHPEGEILKLEDFFTSENVGLKCC